jgi:hypothetical protein
MFTETITHVASNEPVWFTFFFTPPYNFNYVITCLIQFEFKLPPPKQTLEELFGSFVVHGC